MSTTAVVEIRRELSVLSSRLEAVESRLAQNGDNRALSPELPMSLLEQVRDITQAIFPDKCEFTSEFDPEYPDDRHVVVHVEAAGAPKDIADRCSQWHVRIHELSRDLFSNLRLSVVPV